MSATTRRTNPFGTAAVVFAVLGVLLSQAPTIGITFGLFGVVLACVGITIGVRTEIGLSRAVTGLVLALLALVVSVFVLGLRHSEGDTKNNTLPAPSCVMIMQKCGS